MSSLAPLGLAAALLLAPVGGAWALKTEKLKGFGARTAAEAGQETEVVSEVASVRFSSGTSRDAKEAALKPLGMRVLKERPGGWTLVGLPSGMTVGTGLAMLQGASGVLEAGPDVAYRALKTPNDPYVPSQYHLGKIDAFAAWEYTTGSGATPVTIVVIDSGIDSTHPDLASKVIPGQNQFCDPGGSKTTDDVSPPCVKDGASNDGTPIVACNHATQVAGVAAAVTDNGTGVAGVSWGAKLLSVRVFRTGDCNPSGDCAASNCATDDWAMAYAMDKARALRAGDPATFGNMVINISIGGASACTQYSTVMRDAISNAKDAGIPVLAAAGNDGGAVNAPGNCPDAIPVGATDVNDNIAYFSSRGTELSDNGFVAPGVNLYTTTVGGYTGSASGTSFSSPIGAGAAALILAYKPAWGANRAGVDSVKANLRGSAESVGVASLGTADASRASGNTAGAGRLNAFRAMRLTANGTLAGFAGDEKAIAFPNPFKPSEHGNVTITIPTSLRGKNPRIRIYTMDGQLVRDLQGNTSWNGKNDGGNPVATGTYIFSVKTDQGHQNGRVAVIR